MIGLRIAAALTQPGNIKNPWRNSGGKREEGRLKGPCLTAAAAAILSSKSQLNKSVMLLYK